MKHFFPLFALLILFGQTSVAQLAEQRQLRFSWDNDFMYYPAPTDYYYTNGLKLDYLDPALQFNPINLLLLRLSPDQHIRAYGLQLWQGIYTPVAKDTLALISGDRPFASVLTLESYALSIHPEKGYQLRTGLQVGVLGPWAGGQQVQNGIHNFLASSEAVVGWVNEVEPAVVINYNVQFNKRLFHLPWLRGEAAVLARVGTLYNDIMPSLSLETGLLRDPFFHFTDDPGRKFYVGIGGTLGLRVVGYDATLKGALIKPDERFRQTVDTEQLQWKGKLGLRLGYHNTELQIGWTYNSPEFKGGRSHWYGTMGLQVNF